MLDGLVGSAVNHRDDGDYTHASDRVGGIGGTIMELSLSSQVLQGAGATGMGKKAKHAGRRSKVVQAAFQRGSSSLKENIRRVREGTGEIGGRGTSKRKQESREDASE